jgi:hypothetical protein
MVGDVMKAVGKIRALLTDNIPPELILNRHCPECGYQRRCREITIEKDDLSLLSGMTEKERKKLNSKGIFTVTQLSYTFRPRRRPKKLRDKREKYHHSLKALAIREKKIHIVGSPAMHIEGTPIYLDVEGVPDRDFYYLIGVRIRQSDSVVQHSLWAVRPEDEEKIWREFLEVLAPIEKPVLIHYGSYETTFIKTMCSRYGTSIQTPEVFKISEVSSETNIPLVSEANKQSNADKTLPPAINLLSVIYGHVYFPVTSNGLKDIAGYCGFLWSETLASGLQSIVWRENWEISKDKAVQEKLICYNSEDCEALEVLTWKVHGLQYPQAGHEGMSEKEVDISIQKREHPYGFKRNNFLIPEFEHINQAAYWDYQRERVYLKTNPALKQITNKSASPPKKHVPNQIIDCQRPNLCPKCRSKTFYQNAKHIKIVIDLKFTRYGIKKWVILYLYKQYLCKDCGKTFLSYFLPMYQSHFGKNLIAYSIYQCIELRLPIVTIDKSLNKLFSLDLAEGTTNRIKAYAAKIYEETYNSLLTKLCNGSLLHADETKINLRNVDGFVWVFTSMEEVAYFYTDTREGDYVQSLLKDFKGVLVSDFYAAYDSINCPQQKCLIHLIRDINDALYKNPYDEGLKQLAERFTSLLRPMIETIDRFGLKHHFLNVECQHIVDKNMCHQLVDKIVL